MVVFGGARRFRQPGQDGGLFGVARSKSTGTNVIAF
jgi:hypothetical protein